MRAWDRSAEERPAVLVVDDNPANLVAFESCLEPLRLEVMFADEGEAALRASASRDFAVILLDVRMPRMDGIETAERLRGNPRTRLTPIVFTSSYESTPGQVTKAYVAGATDYIPSPVDGDVLRHKVAAFVDLWRRRERLKRTFEKLQRAHAALQSEVAADKVVGESLRRKADVLRTACEDLRVEILSGGRSSGEPARPHESEAEEAVRG